MQNKHMHFQKAPILSRVYDQREKLVINIHGLMRNRVPSVNIKCNSTSYRYIHACISVYIALMEKAYQIKNNATRIDSSCSAQS